MRASLYHRVSTLDQHPEAAREELRQAAQHRGYSITLEVEETGSGARNDRPGLRQVMTAARKRDIDVIIVWKLDRFGRSALDILSNVRTLRDHRVALLCSSQGLFLSDRPDPMSNCMLQMLAAFAELEREQIRERTRLGMRSATARGVHCGRPEVPTPALDQVRELQGQGLGVDRIATRLNTTTWAVRKALKPVKRGTPPERSDSDGT